MDSLITFAALTMATILALFSALALQALLLHVAFWLMQPATADGRAPRPSIARGSQLAAQAFAKAR